MKFHWSIFKNDTRKANEFSIHESSDFCFSIEPFEGYFEKGELKSFTFSFKSMDPTPVYEYASLIVDDIAVRSIRNPPESIKKLLEAASSVQ